MRIKLDVERDGKLYTTYRYFSSAELIRARKPEILVAERMSTMFEEMLEKLFGGTFIVKISRVDD